MYTVNSVLLFLVISISAKTDNTSSSNKSEALINRSFQCCLYNSSLYVVGEIQSIDHFLDSFGKCGRFLRLSNASKLHYLKTLSKAVVNLKDDPTCIESKQTLFCRQKTTPGYIAYTILLAIILIVAVSGNITVIMIYKSSTLLCRRPTCLFINSLAVSDLAVAVSILPIKIMQALYNQKLCSKVVCQLYFTADILFFAASITNIFSVTIDRFITIIFPFRGTDILTFSRVKKWILLIWLYASIWAIFVHLNPGSGAMDNIANKKGQCGHQSEYFFEILYIAVFLIPCIVIGAMYICIYIVTSSHSRAIKQQRALGHISPILADDDSPNNDTQGQVSESPNQDDSHSKNNIMKNVTEGIKSAARHVEWKLTRVLLLVYGSFVFCWTPLVLTYFINNHDSSRPSLSVQFIFIELFPIIHSATNPFIYSLMYKDFRKELKRIVLVRLCPSLVKNVASRKERRSPDTGNEMLK